MEFNTLKDLWSGEKRRSDAKVYYLSKGKKREGTRGVRTNKKGVRRALKKMAGGESG